MVPFLQGKLKLVEKSVERSLIPVNLQFLPFIPNLINEMDNLCKLHGNVMFEYLVRNVSFLTFTHPGSQRQNDLAQQIALRKKTRLLS